MLCQKDVEYIVLIIRDRYFITIWWICL